ncbi:conserved hypothetical protein [Roseibium sp. TrichSKD4]|nr:conserved hypothetical protein [Roseibium sp. TrichSKD4]
MRFHSCRSLFLGLVFLSPCLLTSHDAAADQTEAATPKVQKTPFVTSRNRNDTNTPAKAFGDERSTLKAGIYSVVERDLSVLNSLTEEAPAYIKEELLKVQEVQDRKVSDLLDLYARQAADGSATLYVHGYNISFEKGCRRAAMLRENAGLTENYLWFSWPSDGVVTNYTRDEADLYWSVPDLADVIADLERRLGGDNTNLVAHSLGARGLVLALYEMAFRKPDARFANVVLLAPDMDFGLFQRILPRIRPLTDRLTIYVTSGDIPLALSAQLHGYPRLGQAGNDVASLSGVEVIDLSDLPDDSPTGHLYHIHSRVVGADLDALLNRGKAAQERKGLSQVGENSWLLKQ